MLTPDQILTSLGLRPSDIEPIQKLATCLHDFERILHAHGDSGELHNADTPLRRGILTEAQTCIDLIAQILHADPNDVLQAVLTLFGISSGQFTNSCTITQQIVAFSALVRSRA
jgi:hypothetical protein